jgi:hypothetical protein
LEVVDDYLWLSKEGVQKYFAADVPEKQSELMHYSQGPAFGGLFAEKTEKPAWKEKDSWFIVAKNDQVVSTELQRIMAKKNCSKNNGIRKQPCAHDFKT